MWLACSQACAQVVTDDQASQQAHAADRRPKRRRRLMGKDVGWTEFMDGRKPALRVLRTAGWPMVSGIALLLSLALVALSLSKDYGHQAAFAVAALAVIASLVAAGLTSLSRLLRRREGVAQVARDVGIACLVAAIVLIAIDGFAYLRVLL
jgi:hypothetical protein